MWKVNVEGEGEGEGGRRKLKEEGGAEDGAERGWLRSECRKFIRAKRRA